MSTRFCSLENDLKDGGADIRHLSLIVDDDDDDGEFTSRRCMLRE